MRKILIVGAGQSGLQLALGLRDDGYDVTLLTLQSPADLRSGRVMSTQCLFGDALRRERRRRLAFWGPTAPAITGVAMSVADTHGALDTQWTGALREPAQSVDQRVKMAAWLEEFERRGGRTVLHGATLSDLQWFSSSYDLVVLATGKSELAGLFPVDTERTRFDAPQRTLALAYVRGMEDHPSGKVLHRTCVPGVGEVLAVPSLTLTGPCHALLVEAVPGGPMDLPVPSWRRTGDVLEGVLSVMRDHAPWMYERCLDVELTDAMAEARGGYTPHVRKPVGHLPGGGAVLGMGDAIVANDPITSQGANAASACAETYRRAIVDHGMRPFDEDFMNAAFASYWRHARHVAAWSEVMLEGPPHVWEVLRAAGSDQGLADRFAEAFEDPADLITWFLHPERAYAYVDALSRSGSP
ncbi:styrene monooxygenase/indole monooxygenase family protein [Nocardiopsis baichengensis]|uniref:styrene monooxygenase/indole monooxygenase family protein n=1 Tax=Nocardiopsis baichengensis TaxID=280240 RepID=UPI000347DC93|nr:styrene monooxygenase/indole monooxygenase family protein [Nocardiopsis baichengensis]